MEKPRFFWGFFIYESCSISVRSVSRPRILLYAISGSFLSTGRIKPATSFGSVSMSEGCSVRSPVFEIRYTSDIRNYAKYLLKEGSDFEKRDLLSCLKSKVVLRQKVVTLHQ